MTNVVIDQAIGSTAKDRGRPLIFGFGGTLRPYSSSELALRYALRACEEAGADTVISTARELQLPMYDPAEPDLPDLAVRFLDTVRRADAIIIATPGYHGGLSGLIKNALDYLQELASDPRPYLHDKAVGCIVTSTGWQAGVTTLTSLRSTVHALRGWPSSLGVAINTATPQFDRSGEITDPKVGRQLAAMASQVSGFASSMRDGAR